MKILKKMPEKTDEVMSAMSVFDSLLNNIYSMNLESVEFDIGYDNSVVLNENKASIVIDKNSHYLKQNDTKALRMIILSNMLAIFVRKKIGKKIPAYIENLLVNREIVKRGYADDLSYFFYINILSMVNKGIKNMNEYMDANLPWLSFYRGDKFYSQLFLGFSKQAKVPRILRRHAKPMLNSMKKDLWKEKNMKNAIKVYCEILKDINI